MKAEFERSTAWIMTLAFIVTAIAVLTSANPIDMAWLAAWHSFVAAFFAWRVVHVKELK